MAWQSYPTSERHSTYPDLQAAAPESNSYFSPHVHIPLFTLGPASACAKVESKILAEGLRAGFILYLPNHWPLRLKGRGWLFPTSFLFSRMQQALWKPGRLGFSICLWYLTCQLCISTGNLRCYCDIIIIITGKWAKDSWLSRGFLLGLVTGIPYMCSVGIILSEHIISLPRVYFWDSSSTSLNYFVRLIEGATRVQVLG